MNYEKFTLKAQEAVRDASASAQSHDNPNVEVEHLLYALLTQDEGVVPALLDRIGADKATIGRGAEDLISRLPKTFGEAAQLYLSGAASKALAKAEAEAAALKDDYVAAEHILLGIMSVEGGASSLLKANGVTRDRVLSALVSVRGNRSANDQEAEEKYRVLEKYCRDLTALARADKLDPVIGRDE